MSIDWQMNELFQHYHSLLRLDANWTVVEVAIDPKSLTPRIKIEYCGTDLNCTSCGLESGKAEQLPFTTIEWRVHGNQTRTAVSIEVPNTQCNSCGILPIKNPSVQSEFSASFVKVLTGNVNIRTFFRNLESAGRRFLKANLDKRLTKRGMGQRKLMETDAAEYSYQIMHRRKLYRRMDFLLWWLGIRHIPRECGVDRSVQSCPVLADNGESALQEPQATVWKGLFTESALLVRHDDVLNWQKFHYTVLFFGALMSGYVLSYRDRGSWLVPLVLGCMGILLAWGADLTFQEGLRCLRAHRRKVAALEKKAPPHNTNFLLSGNAYNQRDVLEFGPSVICILSVILTLCAAVNFPRTGSPHTLSSQNVQAKIDERVSSVKSEDGVKSEDDSKSVVESGSDNTISVPEGSNEEQSNPKIRPEQQSVTELGSEAE